MLYVIEVQQYYKGDNKLNDKWCNKFHHIGYYKHIFENIYEATKFYNSELKQVGMNDIIYKEYYLWRSDITPITNIRHVLREFDREYCKLE
jgi:hypothetical protein